MDIFNTIASLHSNILHINFCLAPSTYIVIDWLNIILPDIPNPVPSLSLFCCQLPLQLPADLLSNTKSLFLHPNPEYFTEICMEQDSGNFSHSPPASLGPDQTRDTPCSRATVLPRNSLSHLEFHLHRFNLMQSGALWGRTRIWTAYQLTLKYKAECMAKYTNPYPIALLPFLP